MPDQRLSDQRRPDQRHDRPEPYPAEKARGGEIILRKRWQRVVFIGALAIAVLIGFFLSLWGFWG
jgi:hypothetical protein